MTDVKPEIQIEALYCSTRGDAEHILEQLGKLVDTYAFVTVADLYDVFDLTSSYEDSQWGWTTLSGTTVIVDGNEIRGKSYKLNFPELVSLKAIPEKKK